MPKDYPPPSKPEREGLVRERARDTPRPAPSLRPGGSIGALVDTSIANRKADRSIEREQRISSIDQALTARKDAAKAAHSKAKDTGRAKAAMHRAKARMPDRTGR